MENISSKPLAYTKLEDEFNTEGQKTQPKSAKFKGTFYQNPCGVHSIDGNKIKKSIQKDFI